MQAESPGEKVAVCYGTRLVVAGTISPVICPVYGPTEGRHDNAVRKTKSRKKKNSSTFSWAKDDTRDQKESRDEGVKTKNNRTKQR